MSLLEQNMIAFITANGVIENDDNYETTLEQYVTMFMEQHGLVDGVNEDSDNISIYVDGVNYKIANGEYAE
jgi:hypothetical protein